MNRYHVLLSCIVVLLPTTGLAQERKTLVASEMVTSAQDVWTRPVEFFGRWTGKMTVGDKPDAKSVSLNIKKAKFIRGIEIEAQLEGGKKHTIEISDERYDVLFAPPVFELGIVDGYLPGLNQSKARVNVTYVDKTLTATVWDKDNDSGPPDYKFVLRRPAP